MVRYGSVMFATAFLLAGCGGPQTPRASALAARINSTNYRIVYSFGAPPDGNNPYASLVNVDATLYGTTKNGGSYTCSYSSEHYTCGTVFSVTPGGAEKVLHSFGAPDDGSSPNASLLDVGGTLYGTTEDGGSYRCTYKTEHFGCGTVFSITTSGTENALHSFGARADGSQPAAPLIQVKGALYGTTFGGGANSCGVYSGCGTVFSISTGGTENVLHSFHPHRRPSDPFAGLIYAGGTFYGTTYGGGAHGLGTVFSITLTGRVKVLHNFSGFPDGAGPVAPLIDVKGTFYGTTDGGGVVRGCGCGTVFSITPGGTEKVLHSFGNGADGARPYAALTQLNGTFYGTTSEGGAYSCGTNHTTCGTVFSITPGGTEEVLHNFGNGTDGAGPVASLIEVKGTLYGTTIYGGTYDYGTVFALRP